MGDSGDAERDVHNAVHNTHLLNCSLKICEPHCSPMSPLPVASCPTLLKGGAEKTWGSNIPFGLLGLGWCLLAL